MGKWTVQCVHLTKLETWARVLPAWGQTKFIDKFEVQVVSSKRDPVWNEFMEMEVRGGRYHPRSQPPTHPPSPPPSIDQTWSSKSLSVPLYVTVTILSLLMSLSLSGSHRLSLSLSLPLWLCLCLCLSLPMSHCLSVPVPVPVPVLVSPPFFSFPVSVRVCLCPSLSLYPSSPFFLFLLSVTCFISLLQLPPLSVFLLLSHSSSCVNLHSSESIQHIPLVFILLRVLDWIYTSEWSFTLWRENINQSEMFLQIKLYTCYKLN